MKPKVDLTYDGYRNYETWYVAQVLDQEINLRESLDKKIATILDSSEISDYTKQEKVCSLVREEFQNNFNNLIKIIPLQVGINIQELLAESLAESVDWEQIVWDWVIDELEEEDLELFIELEEEEEQ